MTTPVKVGFWYSKYEPHFPMPKAHKVPYPKQKEFLAKLAAVELVLTDSGSYDAFRGLSSCRLCLGGRANGSWTFKTPQFQWPEGYSHYIQEHNVRPPQEFETFILAVAPASLSSEYEGDDE